MAREFCSKTISCCPGRWGGRGCGRLMCAPVVVGEDVMAAFEVGDGAGDFEDAIRVLKWEVFHPGHLAQVVNKLVKLDDEWA